MQGEQARHRFDVFERRKNNEGSFIVWHGTYRSLAEAEEKLWRCTAESRNEFYVKDLQLGIVMARGNIADTASVALPKRVTHEYAFWGCGRSSGTVERSGCRAECRS